LGQPAYELERKGDGQLIVNLRGEWTFDHATEIGQALSGLAVAEPAVEFHCDGLEAIDLTGAWLLYSKSMELEQEGHASGFFGFKDVHMKFLSQVIDQPGADEHHDKAGANGALAPVAAIGQGAVAMVSDLGQMTMMALDGVLRPSRLALRETINQLMDVGLRAIPIITLMSFLIGIVLGYQASAQLSRLGAGAFTIDLVAISILREMGVMLTAIMVAGRSGSAFAAAIGSMKLNEETDAMQVMGLPVNGTLVLPRILGLVIAVPFLTALSNLAGIVGAWVVSVTLLDISSIEFMTRVVDSVDLDTVMVGLSKAPVFALLIGAVSTMRGLQVMASAEELGRLTTRAVVESIFLVILADAVFSIIYTELGI
jgi:phospholipid/cholesterol/gamma-HCH transport system permease protein